MVGGAGKPAIGHLALPSGGGRHSPDHMLAATNRIIAGRLPERHPVRSSAHLAGDVSAGVGRVTGRMGKTMQVLRDIGETTASGLHGTQARPRAGRDGGKVPVLERLRAASGGAAAAAGPGSGASGMTAQAAGALRARSAAAPRGWDARPRRQSGAVRLALLLAAVAASGAAPVEPRPSFAEAVAMAWARSPDRLALEGRGGAAAARSRAAHTLFPNAPFATAIYDDDHLVGSNKGYTTYSGSLNTPLWLPGEGTATARSAGAELAHVAAQDEAGRLLVAGQVLDAAAGLAIARNVREVAGRRLASARLLLSELHRLVRGGESAQIDEQAAAADLATAEIALSDADAQLASAGEALAVLTGTRTPPDLTPPAAMAAAAAGGVADEAAIGRNPQVAAAQRGVDAAQAELRLVRLADRDDPELGVEAIRDHQFGSPWDTRYGVVVRVPFASRARNLPRIALAQSTLTSAFAELTRVQRLVRLGLVQSRAQLDAARRARDAGTVAARQLAARAATIGHAWHLGEMPLIEVVRAQQASFDATLIATRAAVAADVASLRMSLAGGVVP